MRKLIMILAYLLSYNTKIRIGDIKFVSDKETLKKVDEIEILDWTEEQLKLKNTILKGGYGDGYNNNLPKITRDNVCIDGHHMVMSLKQSTELNYVIKVKRVWLVNWFTIYKMYKNEI